MNQLYAPELVQKTFEQRQIEATDMLNSIEDQAWMLYSDVGEFRVVLRNLEDVRSQLAKS